jgi:hypothetical protein
VRAGRVGDMEKCKHDKGSYPAEEIEDHGVIVYQHYRCNGCDIILETRKR